MVKIYALINPFNNEPFYVGRTESLDYRITMHSSDFMRRVNTSRTPTYSIKRDAIIKSIRDAGLKLNSIVLIVCPKKAAPICEQYIYDLLTKNGYELLQRKKCG